MIELEQDDMVPPSYALAVTLRDMQALYAGGHIPSGTTVALVDPNSSDRHLRSTVWITDEPVRYIRIFDGMQDHLLTPTTKD